VVNDRQAAATTASQRDGREATSPWQLPLRAWRDVVVRTWKEADADNVALIAAGVSFYGFLALVPLLGAVVLAYGFLADPDTVLRDMTAMMAVMPKDIAALIAGQLLEVVQTSGGRKGLGVVIALAVALFGARNGASAIVTALNIAYEEEERRGFFKVNLLALAITAAGVAVAVASLLTVAAFAYVETVLPASRAAVALVSGVIAHLLLALMAAAVAATLYRFGPCRRHAKWRWLTPGSLLFAAAFVGLTLGFGFYVKAFGNYNATYGSLAAVVILLTYLYLSSYILIFGAELNSELEHQTARDSTKGSDKPLGGRGAWVADHVAAGADIEDDNPEAGRKVDV
jgi:membrane protein